jgi:protein-tyrosine phosphatase/atypical dual specificity phosphatase
MNIYELNKEEESFIIRDESIPDMISERLYIGNMLNASDKECLKKIGITHILIFASYIDPQFPTDFIYKQIEVHDLPSFNIKNSFDECYK